MIHPINHETQSQSIIQRIDALGRAALKPHPAKLAAVLAASLVLPDIGLRLLVAILAIWFALRSLPATAADKVQRETRLPTGEQVNRVAKWLFVASAASVLVIIIGSVLAHARV